MANAKRIETFGPAQIRALLGPAEAQYGPQTLTLGMQGGNGAAIACGSTVVDESPQDFFSSNVGVVGVLFVWNDLSNETGFRQQADLFSTTFVTEDSFNEFAANTTSNNNGASPGNSITERIIAHVGHAPGHGATPIAGDVVSNPCSFTPAGIP